MISVYLLLDYFNFYIAISFINYASMYGKLNSAEVTERERMETDTEKLKSSKTDRRCLSL